MPEPTVRVSSLAKKGALLAGALALMSLVLWLVDGFILVNPVLALLVLVQGPFLWFMGWKIERDHNLTP